MKKFVLISLLFATMIGAKSFAGADDLAYFQQFLYQKENTSDDPDFPEYQYRYVMTKWNDMVQMPDGRYLNPAVSLYMYADQTFLLVYKENYFQTPDSQQFMPGPCKKITGNWSVPDKQLVLEGVGHADRATSNGNHAMLITYEKDLGSPGLTGHTVNAELGYSNTDMIFCF